MRKKTMRRLVRFHPLAKKYRGLFQPLALLPVLLRIFLAMVNANRSGPAYTASGLVFVK